MVSLSVKIGLVRREFAPAINDSPVEQRGTSYKILSYNIDIG